MPTDSRRLNGPSESFSPYNLCAPTDNDLGGNLQSSVINKGSLRTDERLYDQLRPIFLRAGVVSQARGSCYVEMGKTKLICAIYGPREVLRREEFSLKGQLTCDFKFMTFSCNQRRQHQQDEQDKDISLNILEALEPAVCLHKYPKSQINIYIMVLQNDGSALAASITGATIALASAGVDMYDLVLSSSVAQHGPLVLSDPTLVEENAALNSLSENCAGTVTVGFLPSVNQISAVSSDGYISAEKLKKHIQVCVENCQKMYPVVCQCLVNHLKETPTELNFVTVTEL